MNDTDLLRMALVAMKYHRAQTRPIEHSNLVIAAIETRFMVVADDRRAPDPFARRMDLARRCDRGVR